MKACVLFSFYFKLLCELMFSSLRDIHCLWHGSHIKNIVSLFLFMHWCKASGHESCEHGKYFTSTTALHINDRRSPVSIKELTTAGKCTAVKNTSVQFCTSSKLSSLSKQYLSDAWQAIVWRPRLIDRILHAAPSLISHFQREDVIILSWIC